jgi:hypothetical protein
MTATITIQDLRAAAIEAAKHAKHIQSLLAFAESGDVSPEEAAKRLEREAQYYADKISGGK